jgi:hypothetical protein
MDFPKLLEKAIFKNSSVCFYRTDLDADPEDKDFVEYIQWKAFHKIDVLRLSHLKKLHKKGFYVKELHRLFSKNQRLNYLE